MDLDGDGTEELLFGNLKADTEGTPLYDLYTIDHAELVHVFDGWDRNRYYLTTDGWFMRHGSNSAFNSFTSFYAYAQGEMHLLRSIIYDSEKNKDNRWFLSYTNENDAFGSISITQEEATKILSCYDGKFILLTPFKN